MAKEVALQRTHTAEAPWWVMPAVDKKRTRLDSISHLLGQLPYHESKPLTIELPERVFHPDHMRHPDPAEMMVSERC